jgi:hypothetical protein
LVIANGYWLLDIFKSIPITRDFTAERISNNQKQQPV